MRHLLAAISLTAIVLLVGCNAPHDNPLDPASTHYRGLPSVPPDLRGRVTSVHEAHTGFDTYFVSALLEGTFAPRLDSIWLSFNGRAVFGSFLFDSTVNQWQANYTASSFGDSHLGNVVGRPFMFLARDSAGVQYEVGPCYVWRVIEDSPVIVAPVNYEIVSPHPTLTWQPFATIFPVSFHVEIEVPNDTADHIIWQASNLPAGVSSITVPDSLPDSTYFWEIMAVDSFENASLAQAAYFVVSHGLPL